MVQPLRIAPSILSANFATLGAEIEAVEAAGANWIHVDVMDGRFVPNITIGPPVVAALRKTTKLPLDVHLMIVEPERYIDAFAHAGADIISVHAEACTHLHRTLQQIRALGKRAGVVFNPHSPVDALRYVRDSVDLVLIMSVNPGFGGQAFLPEVLPKFAVLKEIFGSRPVDFQIDGGITKDTAQLACAHGANVLVAGNAVFAGGPSTYPGAIATLRAAAATAGAT
jgi:ribulose-phosphate 3-epimerase